MPFISFMFFKKITSKGALHFYQLFKDLKTLIHTLNLSRNIIGRNEECVNTRVTYTEYILISYIS